MPRLQSLTLDPLELLGRLDPGRRWLLLHSGRFHARWAARSILASPTGTYRFISTRGDHTMPNGLPIGRSHWSGPAGIVPVDQFTHDPFDDLRRVLKATPTGAQWIGYLSYDLGRFIEHLPSRAKDDRGWPLIELELCENVWVHDTVSGEWRGEQAPPMLASDAAQTAPGFSASNLRSVFGTGEFEKVVARTIEYIAAGDIFQANLAQRFTADFAGQYPFAARALFQRMAQVSPAWFGAYLELGDLGDAGVRRAIASISPELFLQLDAGGNVITRPIKGTRPASVSADVLRGSMKDIAELNMIVDLLRNDLGRVCRFGSVRVPEARSIESHPTVHHGVATVTGTLRPEADVVDLLRATLPGGSITGAPKIRAMEVIDELEPVRRGPYCGVIGSLTANSANLSIAIRTALVELDSKTGRGRVDFSVGGGIIADSVPAMEHAETLDKAEAILQALNMPRP
jgi:para-aminobenzoate synthetase component 1